MGARSADTPGGADSSLGASTTGAPTGREVAATRPGVNPHTGEQQGSLIQHPKGSNGGVHRGPDKFPRANVMRAVVMMTLAATGYRVRP
jgi:hypothetical protein